MYKLDWGQNVYLLIVQLTGGSNTDGWHQISVKFDSNPDKDKQIVSGPPGWKFYKLALVNQTTVSDEQKTTPQISLAYTHPL